MARFGAYYGRWAPYVSVAERRRKAAKKVAALRKKGKNLSPVRIEGRTIARTFWGKAWCDNLESYSDYSNRLPRGRTYVRNGSVIDLQIGKSEVTALVSGSSIYKVKVSIQALGPHRWKAIIQKCAGQIDSLVELLQGRVAHGVMEIITGKEQGLFPSPKHISMECSCPDWATMCKHVAAVLYGVGARLDERPELFFRLRNVDHAELVTAASTTTAAAHAPKPDKVLKSDDLSSIFGIDLDTGHNTGGESAHSTKGSPERKRSGREGSPKRKKVAARKRNPQRKIRLNQHEG